MNDRLYPFEELSIWIDEPADLQPALASGMSVDVVIIGGGLTGLSTALVLRKRGYDVAIVEKEFCGAGASGRNAGHLSPTIGKDIPSILKMFGKEKSKRLLEFANTSIDHTVAIMEELAIDCDYVPHGNIVAAVHSSQEASLARTAEAARELGAHVQYLDRSDMRGKAIPSAFKSGIWETLGGVLHPGKYVAGMRQAVLQAGVRVFENCPMVRVTEGPQPVVTCEHGAITADYLVMATNAYTNSTGRMKRAVLPMRVTLFETEPLSEEQRARLGWHGKEGIYTAHEMLENFRLTNYGTLQGGSKLVRSTYGGGLAEGYDVKTFASLESTFRDRFPELPEVKIAKWWGGWIGLTTNFLPKIGRHPDHPNMLHGMGFNGHGVPQATITGTILADAIAGEANRFEDLFAKPGLNWPPEPLTWLVGKALTGGLGALDRRIDAKIRKGA